MWVFWNTIWLLWVLLRKQMDLQLDFIIVCLVKVGFKGSNMIMCVLLVSNSLGRCLAAGWSLRLHPHDRSTARQHPGEFDTNNTHTIVFDPNYSMLPPFSPTATHILLIKSNLKFESRATAVSIAMSSHYLGGKYRSRLHPRSRKCECQFFVGDWACESNCAKPMSPASRGDNKVDHVVCSTAESRMPTVHLNENGKFYTTTNIRVAAGQYVFQWDRLLGEFGFWSSGSSPVPWWCETLLVHEFQMWRQRCKQIDPHWFQMSNVFLVHVINHIVWIFHNIPGPTF